MTDDEVLRALLDKADELNKRQSMPSVTQLMMPPPTDGERAVHQVRNVVFLLAGLLVGAALGFGLYLNSIKSDTQETRDKQERVQDYLNMLWRNYPELRETALKAKEKEKTK